MTATTVLVTGAGSGIGAAVVVAAGSQGASVAAVDVDAEQLDRVVALVAQAGASDVLALEADVRSEHAVQEALARCCERLGVPTAVLANAGIEVNAAAHELPLQEWNRTIEVNLTGAFLTARHAIREMLREGVGGSVVCTSSPAAFVGFAGGNNAAYAASKGGISAMVRSLALEYGSAGIRVNGVVPGATDTPLLTVAAPAEQRGELRNHIVELAREQVPLGRLGTPEEVASAVLWLWSEAASYVTGSHLVVDGGLLAKGANNF
jgi:NAD(P)-dependent dehydrogenase (short-subunit alcohol dehydrogenase family)